MSGKRNVVPVATTLVLVLLFVMVMAAVFVLVAFGIDAIESW